MGTIYPMLKGKDAFLFFLSACTVIILAIYTAFILPYQPSQRVVISASSGYR